MLGCSYRHWILYIGNNFSSVTLRLAKLTLNVFTDHTQAISFNTVLPHRHTQLIYTNYEIKPHRSLKALPEHYGQYSAVHMHLLLWIYRHKQLHCAGRIQIRIRWNIQSIEILLCLAETWLMFFTSYRLHFFLHKFRLHPHPQIFTPHQ